jgi:hypothetical protein
MTDAWWLTRYPFLPKKSDIHKEGLPPSMDTKVTNTTLKDGTPKEIVRQRLKTIKTVIKQTSEWDHYLSLRNTVHEEGFLEHMKIWTKGKYNDVLRFVLYLSSKSNNIKALPSDYFSFGFEVANEESTLPKKYRALLSYDEHEKASITLELDSSLEEDEIEHLLRNSPFECHIDYII